MVVFFCLFIVTCHLSSCSFVTALFLLLVSSFYCSSFRFLFLVFVFLLLLLFAFPHVSPFVVQFRHSLPCLVIFVSLFPSYFASFPGSSFIAPSAGFFTLKCFFSLCNFVTSLFLFFSLSFFFHFSHVCFLTSTTHSPTLTYTLILHIHPYLP